MSHEKETNGEADRRPHWGYPFIQQNYDAKPRAKQASELQGIHRQQVIYERIGEEDGSSRHEANCHRSRDTSAPSSKMTDAAAGGEQNTRRFQKRLAGASKSKSSNSNLVAT